jgi:subtilisin family serine protease
MRNVIKVLLAIILSVYFISCDSKKTTNEKPTNKDSLVVTYIKTYKPKETSGDMVKVGEKGKEVWVKRDELIVLNPLEFDSIQVLKAFNLSGVTIKNLRIKKYCDECNGKVLLLGGDDIQNCVFHLAPGGGDACTNPNQPCNAEPQQQTEIPRANEQDSVETTATSNSSEFRKPSGQITLAILDTGIDPNDRYFIENVNNFFTNSDGTIMGIDVVNEGSNMNIIDDAGETAYVTDGVHHGTKVTKIILSQIKRKDYVKILPIKITNDCPGSLYDALCGLYTAQKYGADIINVSWSYEAYVNDGIYRLTRKVFRFLEEKNVTVVAAAGNQGRNLDQFREYPACFKDSSTNIYSVTTLRRLPLRPSLYASGENWSTSFVDIGVLAANSTGIEFKVPEVVDNVQTYSYHYGTSYATAYFTGYLCENRLVHESKVAVLNRPDIHRQSPLVVNMPDCRILIP